MLSPMLVHSHLRSDGRRPEPRFVERSTVPVDLSFRHAQNSFYTQTALPPLDLRPSGTRSTSTLASATAPERNCTGFWKVMSDRCEFSNKCSTVVADLSLSAVSPIYSPLSFS